MSDTFPFLNHRTVQMGRRVIWNEHKIAELLEIARSGESWEAINAHFYPGDKRSRRATGRAFDRYATSEDKAARQRALADRNFNQPAEYRNRGCGGSSKQPEPALQREMRSPWAGMGNCFA